MHISHNYTYNPSRPHPVPLGHHKAAGWAPCVTEQLLISCFMHESVYMLMLLSSFIPLSFPHCVHKFILYICISIPSLQIGTSIPFF